MVWVVGQLATDVIQNITDLLATDFGKLVTFFLAIGLIWGIIAIFKKVR
jgi:hypothetical protein